LNAAVAEAERRQEVREAATAWRDAEAIDDVTLRAIVARYADDRVRFALWLRILAGVATFIGGVALAVLVVLILWANSDPATNSLEFAIVAVISTIATEWMTRSKRRAQGGIEEATAVLAVLFATVAVALQIRGFPINAILLTATAICLAAGWRWGYPLFALAATISGACWLARFPHGRTLWLLGSIAGGTGRLSPDTSPSTCGASMRATSRRWWETARRTAGPPGFDSQPASRQHWLRSWSLLSA